MNKFKPGDIFTGKLANDQYIFGRVLLDVKKQCFNKKVSLGDESSLRIYQNSILVEIYKKISDTKNINNYEVLISGIFTDGYSFEDDYWDIVDHLPVNPEEIDMPEGLLPSNSNVYFVKGEVKIKIPKPEPFLEKVQVRVSAWYGSGALLDDVFYYLTNSKISVNGPFYNSDLRFNSYRNEIYKQIKEDMDLPYYEMSLKYGFDLKRFY